MLSFDRGFVDYWSRQYVEDDKRVRGKGLAGLMRCKKCRRRLVGGAAHGRLRRGSP
jgi:hypothetical protein